MYNETMLELINSNLREITGPIKGECEYCNSGFYLEHRDKCSPTNMNFSKCTIISMFKNGLYNDCKDFCRDNHYALVILNLTNKDNKSSYLTISEIFDNLYTSVISLSEIKSLGNHTLCIDNSDKNFNNCIIVKFNENEKKYVCHLCREGYFLYEETNQCIQYDENFNCEYENIGNKRNPIYSCKKCRQNYYYNDDYYNYNNYFYYYQYDQPSQYINGYYSDYFLVKEDNIKICVRRETNLEYCLNATVDTTYAINEYNCTSCEINHLPYYSEFYERYICQNIFEEIETFQNIDLDIYQYYQRIEAIDGNCPNNKFFTPDREYCYKCNSYIGMPGCKSECSFSLEKIDIIKCLDGCIDGYIESSEGICQSCYEINNGCEQCHYGEYPINYFGIKRLRKFICDYCYSDYFVLIDDKCARCNHIENDCNRCEIMNDKFKCKECYSRYLLDEEGHCNYCDGGFIHENNCIKCNDTNKGGIEGCTYCDYYEDKVTCLSCEEGYILLENNKTCLKISKINGLIKYNKCREITLKDNKFHCLECNDYRYSVLKEDNESICIYLPELNGYFDWDVYNYDDLYYYEKNPDLDYIYNYYFIKYISYNYYSHCVEVINLGSNHNPLYSCIKCYSLNYLFTEENSNISYCIYYYLVENNNKVQNCKDKKIKIMDKEIKFTCVSCYEENDILIYDEIDKVNYCKYNKPIELEQTITDIKICMVKNCKQCKSDDEYFCEICELENYVVNDATGACMEKMESVPAITWKDIFRLEMNSEKEVNGKIITGPMLNLRGETNSNINSGHAFIIYLIFQLKQPLTLRNLQINNDTIRIKAICEIINGVSENKNDTNIVDYECIGDNEGIDLTNYQLNDIEVDNDDKSNLKELTSTKNLLKLETGPTIEFKMNELNNQTSKNYNFDFTIKGKIDDNNLKEIEINKKFKMNEIDELSHCLFKIEKQKMAYLNCKLNIEKYKKTKSLTFNTTKIEYNNEYNISLLNLNKVYLINEAKSDNRKKIWVIIGIVVGVIAFITLLIVLIFICKKRNKQKSKSESINSHNNKNIQEKSSDNLKI